MTTKRLLTRIIAIAFIGLISFSTCMAQGLNFKSWGTENGLSSNSVFNISQDLNGIMWIRTGKGISRFDGRVFYKFEVPKKFHQQNKPFVVSSILVDKNNILWIGNNTGIIEYDISRNVFSKVTVDSIENIGYMSLLTEDRTGVLWASTSKGLIFRKKSGSSLFSQFDPKNKLNLKGKRIYSIYADAENTIWVGSNNGLTKLKGFETKHEAISNFSHEPHNKNSISETIVTCIEEDTYGNLWVGTQNSGINLLNKKEDSFIHVSTLESPFLVNNHVRAMKADTSGNIWIGTQEGLSIVNWRAQTCKNYQNDPNNEHSISQNSIHSIFIDRNNLVWLGTFFGGLNIADPLSNPFETWKYEGINYGLSNNIVSSITEGKDGNFWIGTEGGGITRFDPSKHAYTYYKEGTLGLASNLIKKLYKDKNGQIWIGTHAGGLLLFRNGKFIKYLYNPENPLFLLSEITSIAEDPNNNILVGRSGGIKGLTVFKQSGQKLVEIGDQYNTDLLKDQNIKNIFLDSRNNIWVSSDSNLYVCPSDKKRFHEFSLRLPIDKESIYINCIQEDRFGRLWFGLEKQGLRKLDPFNNQITAYTFKNMTDLEVFGILEDDNGSLWISTRIGLIKFNHKNGTILQFTKIDGLPSNSFNQNAVLKDNDGFLYFGGHKGLVRFNPNQLPINKTTATLFFTKLKILNESFEKEIFNSNELSFNHSQNVFTIEFSYTNYIKAEKNQYAYRLIGFDNEWTISNSPSVSYMNLSPGRYTLEVSAANNDGKGGKAKNLLSIYFHPFGKHGGHTCFTLCLALPLFF